MPPNPVGKPATTPGAAITDVPASEPRSCTVTGAVSGRMGNTAEDGNQRMATLTPASKSHG